MVPDDGFMTEELPPDVGVGKYKHLWLIDPLDGTDNCLKRDGQYFREPLSALHHGLLLRRAFSLRAADHCSTLTTKGYVGSSPPVKIVHEAHDMHERIPFSSFVACGCTWAIPEKMTAECREKTPRLIFPAS